MECVDDHPGSPFLGAKQPFGAVGRMSVFAMSLLFAMSHEFAMSAEWEPGVYMLCSML